MQRENTERLALQSSWKIWESRVLLTSCRTSRPPRRGGGQPPSCKFPVTGQHLELLLPTFNVKISKPCANLSDLSLQHIMRQVSHYFTDKSTETQRLSGQPKITQQACVPQIRPLARLVRSLTPPPDQEPFWGSATLGRKLLLDAQWWTEEKGQTEPPKLDSG